MTTSQLLPGLPPEDLEDLRRARTLLEGRTLAHRISEVIGVPVEKGFELLPEKWHGKILDITRSSLSQVLRVAATTMNDRPGQCASEGFHRLAVAASGAVGGFFGLSALALELPLSTGIMLRSIADIARSEGESIRERETRLACLEVFALGGPGSEDDGSETSYLAVRMALAQQMNAALRHVVKRGVIDEGAPVVARLIAQVAQRFSVQVSEKVAAQSIPAIGAVGGSLVNTMFINHFQDMARGHFIVRRLERRHGTDAVRAAWLLD